ncbi:MAG: hypothetical protein CMI54_00795 [Parcubacteria group bacterium]|jgi:hypothetical protein|nr:hypothetical protein [Parcubacteria group bacterium]|tara:strand:+ start:9212 stop:10333 length:1122 start_codon:yes stop_codon:yes gene_type:complete
MPETDIGSVSSTDMTNIDSFDYSVDAVSTDGAGDQKETEWQNSEWTNQLGYYKAIPELQAAIDAKATWTVGKGFKSNPLTQLTLMNIQGVGTDTFNTILENMIRTYNIGGDSYAEIIRDTKGKFINLKPLDPSTIKIIANRKGIIIRYEKSSKITNKRAPQKFKPENIFHLSRNRVADEIHGCSLIDSVENIILMRNEAMADYKKVMHRNVQPVRIWKLDTDDATEISAFKTKVDAATKNQENILIPKGTVELDQASVAPNSTLNPLPWIQQLNQYFFQATGVPQIIVGGAQEITEASAKIAYLAFEQTIEEEQLYIEEQVLAQLNLEINLEFPASLENELLSDKAKSETMQASTPEDTSVTSAGLSPAQGVQ